MEFHSVTRIKQISTLYLAMMLTIVLGFVTSVINTRSLGPGDYGNYKFIMNVYQFLVTISSIGIFNTGAQVVATVHNDTARKNDVIGGLLIYAGIISLFVVCITALFALIEPILFGNNLTIIILWTSPIVAAMMFDVCFENILQGDNRIFLLSLFRILPTALFMVILVLIQFIFKLNIVLTLLAQLVTIIGVTISAYFWLRPRFGRWKEVKDLIWNENKRYGWHVYIGVLSNVATAYLSTFMISYYLDNTHVGYFSLALTLTMPLAQLSSVVGTTYFKDFAHRNELPRPVTISTIALALLAMGIFILFIRPVVLLVYSDKFITVAMLAMIIAVGSTMQGVGDYFNRFLGAHARGKDLRNGAFVVGGINVLGYVVLIKFLGVNGAALTKMVAGTVYCSMMIIYYLRCVRLLKNGQRIVHEDAKSYGIEAE